MNRAPPGLLRGGCCDALGLVQARRDALTEGWGCPLAVGYSGASGTVSEGHDLYSPGLSKLTNSVLNARHLLSYWKEGRRIRDNVGSQGVNGTVTAAPWRSRVSVGGAISQVAGIFSVSSSPLCGADTAQFEAEETEE